MDASNLSTLVPWVISHGYFLFLIASLIEGPMVTIAAGVGAALGVFNLFFIVILAILGDIGGDLFFYTVGYKSRKIINTPFFQSLGLTESRVKRIEQLLHKHTRKAVILIKVSPFIGTPGIIIIGATHTPFKKFFETAVSVAIPKTIFYSVVGFLSGQAYLTLSKVIKRSEYVFLVIIALIILIYFLNRLITGYITRKVD
ncbi:MAG: VTT domain-containing protein [Candidatus Paceibacterota bacterium]